MLLVLLKFLTYIGVFVIAFYLLFSNNNRLYFLLKAISIISFIIILTFLISNIFYPGFHIHSNRIKFVFDRVIDSEIIISFIGFALFTIIGTIKSSKRNTELLDIISSFRIKEKYLFYIAISGFLFTTIQIILLLFLRTRMSWIALILMTLITLFIIRKYYLNIVDFKRLIISLIGILLFSISVNLLIHSNIEKERISVTNTFKSIFEINYYSNQARIGFWKESLKMFTENPIRGIGPGKWAGIYPVYSGESYTDENVDMNSAINPHNDYIEVLIEFGIFGFIIFTGFIFTGLYFLFKKSKQDIVYLPFFLSALGLSITMFFSFTKENFGAMMVFSICMAVGYSSNLEFKFQNSELCIKYKRYIKSFILSVVVLLLVTGIWFKVMSYLNEREYLEAMNLKAQRRYGEMLIKLDGVSVFFYPVDMNKMPVDYYRGVGYFELKQYDKALEKFQNARRYMKYYPTIMNNEASALYMMGNIKKAENLFIEIKNLFPNYIEPQINLLSLYINTNKYHEAKNITTEIETKIFDGKYVKNYSVFLGIKNYLIDNQK